MFILETFSSVFEYKTFLVKIALLVKGRFPVTRFSCTCTRIVKYLKIRAFRILRAYVCTKHP